MYRLRLFKERVIKMTDYGKVRSTVKPLEKVIDDFSVWINTDISKVEAEFEGEAHTEYEFHQVRYGKDEYLKLMDEKNIELQTQLTDTQLALCEIYEEMI